MKKLEDYTEQELVDEIARRKEVVKNKPRQFDKPDYDKLKKTCANYIDFIASPEYYEDNDWRAWIFESALSALYGNELWGWINKIRH